MKNSEQGRECVNFAFFMIVSSTIVDHNYYMDMCGVIILNRMPGNVSDSSPQHLVYFS